MNKIEIDLEDILGDESGTETIQGSIRRQVVANISEVISQTTTSKINEEIYRIMNEEIAKAISIQMHQILNDLMNAPYTPVDRLVVAQKRPIFGVSWYEKCTSK